MSSWHCWELSKEVARIANEEGIPAKVVDGRAKYLDQNHMLEDEGYHAWITVDGERFDPKGFLESFRERYTGSHPYWAYETGMYPENLSDEQMNPVRYSDPHDDPDSLTNKPLPDFWGR